VRLSAKGEYAIKAVLDLAMHEGSELQPVQEIAARQRIPQRYLEQVLLQLRRGGMLTSKRGSSGGYRLATASHEITVGAVLRAVEGGGDLERGERGRPAGRGSGPDELAGLWQEIADALWAVVDATTFADLRRQVEERRAAARPMYHI